MFHFQVFLCYFSKHCSTNLIGMDFNHLERWNGWKWNSWKLNKSFLDLKLVNSLNIFGYSNSTFIMFHFRTFHLIYWIKEFISSVPFSSVFSSFFQAIILILLKLISFNWFIEVDENGTLKNGTFLNGKKLPYFEACESFTYLRESNKTFIMFHFQLFCSIFKIDESLSILLIIYYWRC